MTGQILCPHCEKEFLVEDAPFPVVGRLRGRIFALIDQSPEINHTLSSIADAVRAPEATVRGLLHSMQISREIYAVRRSLAIIYEVEESGEMLRTLDNLARPADALELFREMSESDEYDFETLKAFVAAGKVERIEGGEPVMVLATKPDGSAEFVRTPDQARYRSVPVTLLE